MDFVLNRTHEQTNRTSIDSMMASQKLSLQSPKQSLTRAYVSAQSGLSLTHSKCSSQNTSAAVQVREPRV